MKDIAIGIDIGGTNSKFGLVDREGTLLSQGSILTLDEQGPQAFLERIYEQLEIKMAQSPEKLNLKGIGIGAPNANLHTGTIDFPANLSWDDHTPLVSMFQKFYPVPMLMTNDANAAAVGEMTYGAAQGMKDFILITLGTGLGSGIISNGKSVVGHDGLAAEMGHIVVQQEGRACGCGRKGCLETYVSATGIVRTAFDLLANSTEESILRQESFESLTAAKITEAAKRGDPIAIQSFEFTGKMLGKALANAVAYVGPEAIFLWGGLAKAGLFIFEPTRRHFEDNLMKVYQGKVKIHPSGLEGKNIAVLGAAALIWQSIQE